MVAKLVKRELTQNGQRRTCYQCLRLRDRGKRGSGDRGDFRDKAKAKDMEGLDKVDSREGLDSREDYRGSRRGNGFGGGGGIDRMDPRLVLVG
jgi:hypothetical protein